MSNPNRYSVSVVLQLVPRELRAEWDAGLHGDGHQLGHLHRRRAHGDTSLSSMNATHSQLGNILKNNCYNTSTSTSQYFLVLGFLRRPQYESVSPLGAIWVRINPRGNTNPYWASSGGPSGFPSDSGNISLYTPTQVIIQSFSISSTSQYFLVLGPPEEAQYGSVLPLGVIRTRIAPRDDMDSYYP